MRISEQVKELRDCMHRWQSFENVSSSEPFKLLSESADTIETLSAKLAAVNMERSDRYYGGGRIAVDENNLPQGEVLGCNAKGGMAVGKIKKVRERDIRVTDFLGGGLMNCIAYMPLPEPYRP